MKLVIVESPSKAKTIEKYLGQDYIVDASGGHVRDLPEKKLGVDVKNNFEPDYVVTNGKEEVVKRLLTKAKKADEVFLATDPDREGEAISWHLATLLGLDKNSKNRIVFNEISSKAVKNALGEPRAIDLNLVDAQQARRVLDRLVGYKVSPFLCRALASKLSAGRVQSAALRLIVEREQEILNFIPVEYWNVFAFLNFANSDNVKEKSLVFKSQLFSYNGKKFKPSNKEETDEILKNVDKASWVVDNVKKSISLSHAPAPYTTSTMQQDSSIRLSMPSSLTMQVAQNLYEGVDIAGEGQVALVTYIRTDSVRVSKDAQNEALEYIREKYGNEYVPQTPNFYKSKKAAQDAHEAIRPISLTRTPDSLKDKLSKNHYKLYKLIYERFLASQMSEAKYNTLTVDIKAGDTIFRANGKTLLFKGFTAVYEFEREEKSDDEVISIMPDLKTGDVLNLKEIKTEQKFTKPPARFTDASLIKTMEEKGIGRPSTYATVITTLSKRTYTAKEGKYIKPTELAFRVNEILIKNFDNIVDISFTARMEDRLDEIEEGGQDWHKLIEDFYPWLMGRLKNASEGLTEETDEVCEKCGAPMVLKTGIYGKYLACSGYPKCKNIISKDEEVSDVLCDKCGKNMIIKTGRYGKYLACSGYPDCSNIKSMGEELSDIPCEACGKNMIYKNGRYGKYLHCPDCKINKAILEKVGVCPDCGKDVIKRKSKTGKIFYGCSGYPNCKFISWDIPYGKCPKCQSNAVIKFYKANNIVKCTNKECDFEKPYIKEEENKPDAS